MFHHSQAVTAKTIRIGIADMIALVIAKIKAMTLALQDVTHLAFKLPSAARAVFIFVMCHK